MDIGVQSALLAAIVCAAIAISIHIRGRRTRLHLHFVVLNWVLSLMNLAAFLHQVGGQALWLRLMLVVALVLPWSALRFFQTFLGEGSQWVSSVTRGSLVVSILLFPFVLSPLYLSLWLKAVVGAYVFGVLYFCMSMIYHRLRLTASRVESARLWYLVIGGLVAITFSLLDFVPGFSHLFPAMGTILVVIFMFFLSQILIQFRLLDLNEFFGKIAALGVLVSLLAAIYGMLIYFVGDQPGVMFFTSIVASFVVLILFEPLRVFVEAAIARYSLRERFEFGRQLGRLRREMANALELGPLVQLVLERLQNTRRVTHAAIFLIEDEGQSYKCIGHIGPQPAMSFDMVSARDLIDRLRLGLWVVREEVHDDLDELRSFEVETSNGEEVPATEAAQVRSLEATLAMLDAVKAGAAFPIMSDRRLIGVLTLWDDRVQDAYTRDEFKAVQEVANQVAIVVENSKLVDKLRERDRLAALGEMAAGLAHEIRNPLGAIKGAAQILEGDTAPDEADEFLSIIVEEVNRLDKVVSMFLDYARPDRARPGATELNPCLERTIQLVRPRVDAAAVEVRAELSKDLPLVQGDSERLTQVFLNLALNAIEAMEEQPSGRCLQISSAVGRRRELALGGSLVREVVEVVFADTGKGMSGDEQRNIFIPFFTTKARGTGLGLPICQRIIRAFGGSMEVQSQLGEGTKMIVLLPIWGEDAITGTTLRRTSLSGTGAEESLPAMPSV